MVDLTGQVGGLVQGIDQTGLVTDPGAKVFFGLLFVAIACILMGTGIPTTPTYIILASIAAPALATLGVTLLATHFFVFYHGLLADVTPPVALAAYAAAVIAGTEPMRTALGFSELACDPNPLKAKDAPDAIKAAVHDFSMRAVNQATEVEKKRSGYTSEESYQTARKSRIRGEAKLKSLDVSHAEAQQLLVDYYRRPGEDGKPRYSKSMLKFLTEKDEKANPLGRDLTKINSGKKNTSGFDESYWNAARALAEFYGHKDPAKAVREFRAGQEFQAWNTNWYAEANAAK